MAQKQKPARIVSRPPSVGRGHSKTGTPGAKDNFFAALSIEELAKAQSVKPLQNVSVLSGGIPEDEDVDEFLQEIYDARK